MTRRLELFNGGGIHIRTENLGGISFLPALRVKNFIPLVVNSNWSHIDSEAGILEIW